MRAHNGRQAAVTHDAFISYSHEADERLASELERALQRLARPWHRRRGMSIFRDAGNLNLSAHLWGSIQQALDDSRYLIVLASPLSARSPWVTKEIEYWRTHRDIAHLIVVLTDGSLTWDFERGDFDSSQSTAIPPPLHGAFPGEPFYLDMRWVRSDPHLSLVNERFKQQVVQIAAALKGVAVEDVIGEEVEQHRRMIRIRNAAIAGLGVLSLAAMTFGVFAWTQRGAAIRAGEAARRSAEEAQASAREAERQNQEAQRAQKEADASAVVARDKAAEADRERTHAEAEAHSARVALAQASTREAVRLIAENRPFAALAHLARALRASPDDLAARSWLSGIAHDGRSWMSFPHDSAVSTASFSTDGRRVLTTSSDGGILVWDAGSGRRLGTTPGQGQTLRFFSPDGLRVAMVCADHVEPACATAQILDTIAGKPIFPVLRHQDAIRWVAFSPDRRLVATASKDGTVRMWDAVTGEPIGPRLQHPSAVKQALFTPDSRRVVTGSDDGTARVWDALSGQLLVGPFQQGQRLDLMRLSDDGRRLFTVAYDTGQVWDALTGKPIMPSITYQKEPITDAQFSRDGSCLAVAFFWDGTARVWDVDAGKPVGSPLLHRPSLNSVEFSPDGRWLLTASDDKTARVWDVATGQQIGTPFQHEDSIASARFSPDGRRILTASQDKTARVWDVSSGQMFGRTLNLYGLAASTGFSPDGREIVIRSGNAARVWHVVDGQPPPTLQHADFVSATVFSPDGRRILTASVDGTASMWDARTGLRIGATLRNQSPVTDAEFSPDGRRILTVSEDRMARVWDAATGRVLVTLGPHDGPITSSDFSDDGRLIATASEDMTARVWDAATGRPVGPPVRHTKVVRVVDLSPDGRRLLTASNDYTARVSDVVTGRPLLTIQHRGLVLVARFSPDAHSILTVANDTARVWDAQTGNSIGVPMLVPQPSGYTAFSPDGRRIVSGTEDSAARVWDAATGLPVGPPLKYHAQVYFAAFSPDGRQVVTIDRDNTARIWNVLLGGSSPADTSRLADLAEVVGGYRLTERGSLAALNESERRIRVGHFLGTAVSGFVTLDQLFHPFLPGSR